MPYCPVLSYILEIRPTCPTVLHRTLLFNISKLVIISEHTANNGFSNEANNGEAPFFAHMSFSTNGLKVLDQKYHKVSKYGSI